MSTVEEIERLGQVAAAAMAKFERAGVVKGEAIEADRTAFKEWMDARDRLDQAVQAFVLKLVSSASGEV